MDSTLDRASSPVDTALPPWVLAALARPAALCVAANTLSTAGRLWLEWALALAGRALGQTLERTIDLDLAGPHAPDPAAFQFGVVFTHPIVGEGLIALDLTAARQIVDVLESDFANVRGAGSLSGAEQGLLEYVTLACADAAHRDSHRQMGQFALHGFLDDKQTRQWLTDHPGAPIRLRLRTGGRKGTVWLILPAWNAQQPPPLEDLGTSIDLNTLIDLRLALPPILLSAAELEKLSVGDVLLLGARDLSGFAANCALASGTLWRLSPSTIVSDSPTVVTATCAQLSPQVLIQQPAPEGSVALHALMGKLPLTLEQLQLWQPGATVDLPKRDGGVELYRGFEPFGTGELVKVEGELGIRLLRPAPLSPEPSP